MVTIHNFEVVWVFKGVENISLDKENAEQRQEALKSKCYSLKSVPTAFSSPGETKGTQQKKKNIPCPTLQDT